MVKIELYFDHHVANIHRGNFIGQPYLNNTFIACIKEKKGGNS